MHPCAFFSCWLFSAERNTDTQLTPGSVGSFPCSIQPHPNLPPWFKECKITSASGGHPCMQTPKNMSPPAQSVPAIKRLIVPQLAFFAPSLFFIRLGHTLLWILSQVCLCQKAFCQVLEVSASLSSGDHPQTNGQTERVNQDLLAALHRVISRNPVSWSTHLPWVEYAHHFLVCSATGMSPLMASNVFQPPLFPAQEANVAVPSVQESLWRARRVWCEARTAPTRTAARNRRLANRWRSPAPAYQPGQKNAESETMPHTHRTWMLSNTCHVPLHQTGGDDHEKDGLLAQFSSL
ncbi:uncharacterized protein LOC144048726 isoform X3 [Vanacampus margaritifer]